MASDMFMSPDSPSGLRLLRCFRNHSLHSSIHNFLLLYDSETMPRKLGLVRGMRTEVGEELKAGRTAALGGARRVSQDGRLEEPPA